MTRTAAAHSAPPGGSSPEGCCSWKRVRPALRRRLALCSPGRPKAPFSRRLAPAPPRPQQWGRIFRINQTGIRIRGADGTRTAAQCPPGATRRRRRRPRQEGTQERNSSIPSAATHLAFSRLTPPRLSAPFVHEIFAAGTRRLATAWTRRSGAAWTYRKIITTIH